MKSILLASASVIAFAGAAAAEVDFSATATLGYNDTDIDNDTNDSVAGFYWDADINVTLSQTLDNGLTVGATFGFEVADDNNGQDLASSDYVLFLESDTASLYFGDTGFAADKHWVAAGDMEQDGFSANDGETVIRGDVNYGSVMASVSYAVTDADGVSVRDTTGSSDLDQLSLGVTADLGNFNVVVAYQEASDAVFGPVAAAANSDYNVDEMFGLSVGTTFGAADVRLAYAKNNTSGEDSLGVSVAYPFGPVTATFYYVDESDPAGDNMGLNVAYEDGPISVALDWQDDQGVEKIGLEGSYDVGNGLVVYAGYLTEDAVADAFYIAGEYDLGGGASLLVSYADAPDEADDDDDVGANDYQVGTTVEVSFEF